jgi:drug/metabolite transporter (DMT)-like permease
MYVVSAETFAAIPPATLALLRLALGVAALATVAFMRGEPLGWALAPKGAVLRASVVVAASMLMQFGGTALTSGVEGSVVTMSTPVFVLLFGRLLEGERITTRAWGGIFVAAAGVVVLAIRSSSATGSATAIPAVFGAVPQDGARHLIGALLLIGAGATWALFTSLGRPIVAAVGARRAIALSSALALAIIAPIALLELLQRGIDLSAATAPATLGAVAYLGIGATAIGWSAWYRGYAAAPPRTAAGILFLQPLVAALLGIGIFGEAVDATFGLGAALLLGGVALIAREA